MVRCGSLESILLVRLGHFVVLGGKPACVNMRDTSVVPLISLVTVLCLYSLVLDLHRACFFY